MLDWSTLTCALRHHTTYQPDDPSLAERLHTSTSAGVAWRCLRCGEYIIGKPRGHGPTDQAPTPTRGKALRQLIILRLLALLRFLEGSVEIAIGVTLITLQSRVPDIVQTLRNELPLLVPAAESIGWDIENSWIARTLSDLANLNQDSYLIIGAGIAALGLSKWAEGVGLWLAKRWGEYLAVVATSLFIPIEIRELADGISAFKGILFIINVATVIWLIYTKRLFGVRGGKTAAEADNEEAAIVNIEQAAVVSPAK
ncbi:MAG: DUF2127 domain-containing protein [Candidatus Nanopelagicales bacterium]|jgi:uncharacterized membrane protein (DUF2068 family)|nr:DUF2127 domain-containing protein [Candidatus Nanopelagicales bacterium]MDP4824899.1 DUF2127 domain-containing protein [Candidatus Nanopelagicales bacterium]MDP4887431.1 DUF2127 domain-containing protein [Candidatus Nanopelagicales bacterium]